MNQIIRKRKKANVRARVAVVGIGNVLLKDEGVGIHVVRALQEAVGDSRSDVDIVDGGTSLDALLLVEGVRKLILVDAANGGGPPGSIYRFRPDDIPSEDRCLTSLHQMNLRDSLQMLKLTGAEPQDVVIIGIEPWEIDWGLELTPELKGKLPEIVKLIMDELTP